MPLRTFVIAAAGIALLASSSLAATVKRDSGQVSVNAGSGYFKIKSSVRAKTGDQVSVSPDGSAKIVYDDDCEQPVGPGEVAAVQAVSPCKAGLVPFDGGTMLLGAAVVGGAVAVAVSAGGDNGNDGGASP